VLTLNIRKKTGRVVAIKSVTEEEDLMIINKSGITLRLRVADIRQAGRATQGVRLIDLKKRNDVISSVCQVPTDEEEEVETVDGTELPEENGVLETDTVEVEEVTTDDETPETDN